MVKTKDRWVAPKPTDLCLTGFLIGGDPCRSGEVSYDLGWLAIAWRHYSARASDGRNWKLPEAGDASRMLVPWVEEPWPPLS